MAKRQQPTARPQPPAKQDKAELPSADVLEQFEAKAGVGFEKVGARDILIPRLAIMQTLSPQLKRNKPQYIEGAKEGDIVDVGVKDIIGDRLHYLLCHYSKVWIEWAPRDTGRGIVRIHQDDRILAECGLNDRNQPITNEGNLVQETAQFFGFNLDREMRASFLPMSSTQLKIARHWMTLATGEKLPRRDGSLYQAPIFYRSFELTTRDTTDGDNDWKLWNVERSLSLPELFPDVPHMKSVMEQCLLMNEQLAKGTRRGDLSGLEEEREAARPQPQRAGTRARPDAQDVNDQNDGDEPM
jgi:hypothetical protein